MKYIIELPEKVKEKFDNATKEDIYGNYYDYNSVIGNAIKNGTPYRNPLILKCNRMLPDDVIEKMRQVIKKQMEEPSSVVVLPSGFELAEVNVELLEQIKADFEKLANDEWNIQVGASKGLECAIDLIEDRISELKGEQK